MDSLTQITLGAAVGELTLGRKIGNRAMMWGAVAGTIPDLDVLAGFFMKDVFQVMDELQSLMFHRGPMHSLLFAFLFSIVMASYTHWLYQSKTYQKKNFKRLSFGFGLFFVGFAYFLVGQILLELFGLKTMLIGLVVTISIAAYFFWRLWKYYLVKPSYDFDVSWAQWYLLFLLGIGTHPMLDCLTLYGTQIFWPFDHSRIALANISVVDPLYTFPFLVCILTAAFLHRFSRARFSWTLAGVIISSLYMTFTFYHQARATEILKATLAEQQIDYNRTLVTPTIFNNILWSSTVETDSLYYLGLYSFFDQEKKFQLEPIRPNHNLVEDKEDDHTLKQLKFFSNDYYGMMKREDGRLQLNDLRYGTFKGDGSDPTDYIFHFVLDENENGDLILGKTEAGPQDREGENMAKDLWNRMLGNVD
ncbi:MAG: metal-dependent hydrolase [Chitinophagales bacterium]